ncbi:hypothetical protein F969_00588 [Acinetobacter variabilis]|uniref:Inorganic pyrophosphatase domain-containing protein n=2 Tax=Acinetobacter variabilis TaxID=70346 RepID=N8VKA6_9GAMM|nr:hypothetical protein F969_00588 [Acinetobacter variabilis]
MVFNMSKNVVFNFNEISNKDKATKAVSSYFKKAGAEIVQVDVSPNVKRTSGISYRELSLTFADSQVIIFRIKQSGDIYQALLNGKVKPMANQDDHVAAIGELVKAMETGRSAFQAKLAKAKVKLPNSIKTSVPNKEKLLTEKRDALKDAVAAAQQELADLLASLPKSATLDSANDSFTLFDQQAHTAATSPYSRLPDPEMGDLVAGNYYKGNMVIAGMNISIENPADSVRQGMGEDGQKWEIKMKHHYGYFDGSMGADGDELDVFVKNNLDHEPDHAYIISQVDRDGSFDEHKVVIGAESEDDARDIYLSNYKPGWDGLGSIEKVTMAELQNRMHYQAAA